MDDMAAVRAPRFPKTVRAQTLFETYYIWAVGLRCVPKAISRASLCRATQIPDGSKIIGFRTVG